MTETKKKKELLKYFDDMCLFLANHHWTKKRIVDERAVAIRKLIENQATNKVKTEILLKHVDLIIEGLANIVKDKKLPKIPKDKQAEFIQVLIISAFLSFAHDIGMEIEKEII